MNWKILSFILSSEQREKVVRCLAFPTTPTRIAKETEISKAHVSRILAKFVELKIAECKTPDKRKGKIYILTNSGKKVLNVLEKPK